MKFFRKSILILLSSLMMFSCSGRSCIQGVERDLEQVDVKAVLTEQSIQLQGLTQTALAQPIIIVVTATADPNLPVATVNPAGNSAPANPTGGVTVTVSQNTNCREGPGQDFNEIGSLGPGQTAEVIGKDTRDNYWIIKLPDGSGRTCWLWGQYASVNGDTSQVADVPTPTFTGPSGAPKAPTLLDAQVKCSNLSGGDYLYKITLKWADNSDNENKFVIFSSNGGSFSTPPNKTSFSFEEGLPSGTNLSATLTAANEKGESQPVGTGTFQCP